MAPKKKAKKMMRGGVAKKMMRGGMATKAKPTMMRGGGMAKAKKMMRGGKVKR